MSERTKHGVEIVNVVAVATLGQKMDLLAIMNIFRNAEYRPKRFPGLVFRMKVPKTATLIFGSGKMVCTGAKSEKMAIRAVKKVVRELKKAGFIIRGRLKIEIVNIVGTADVGEMVDLEATSDILDNVMYEPEQFPGLIYRMEEPKIVLLIFRSGKMVLTGAKRENQINEATKKMISILLENDLVY